MEFKLFTKPDYFRQLVTDISRLKKGDDVLLATMDIHTTEPEIGAIIEAMSRAAKQGASVSLLVDARAFIYNDQTTLPGPAWYKPTMQQEFQGWFAHKQKTLRSLEAGGGTVSVLNMPSRAFMNPSAGRSHIKTAIINDVVYLGGCNLDEANALDIMVQWNNSGAAHYVRQQLQLLLTTKQNRLAFEQHDSLEHIPKHSTIFIDAGVRKQSTILHEAYNLIDSAEDWLFMTCQFFPGGKTAQRLHAAHKRGVKVELHYSPPTIHGISAPIHYLYNSNERIRTGAELFANQLPSKLPILHAKVLASEKAVLVGSHNYIAPGVTFGTAEIALRVTDPALSAEIAAFMRNQIETAKNKL